MTVPPGCARGHLVRGDDASLVAQGVHDLLGTLVGDNEPGMVVEEYGAAGSEDLDVGAVVDALTTPPFITDRRIVVVREAGRLVAAEADAPRGVSRRSAAGRDPRAGRRWRDRPRRAR